MPPNKSGPPPGRGRTPRVPNTSPDETSQLREELAAARRTIDKLTEVVERGVQTAPQFALFEATARLEAVIAARTRELEEKTRALENANSELQRMTSDLDHIVRQRTRMLAESESQLRKKNAELARMNRTKSEFISIAAHELRTPLTSIVGYLDLIQQGRLGAVPEPLKRPHASLYRNAQRLKRLVEDMLDVSRLEIGRMRLKRAQKSLDDVARGAIAELEAFAAQKKHRIDFEPGGVDDISIDADKIHQVVANLLANSIKYTPEGGFILVATARAGEQALLRVRDNGIGIPAASIERLFEPFSEVTAPEHHTSGGPDSAGLGLYIARGIVELHGGAITVASEEGRFTEFTVQLPARAPEAA